MKEEDKDRSDLLAVYIAELWLQVQNSVLCNIFFRSAFLLLIREMI